MQVISIAGSQYSVSRKRKLKHHKPAFSRNHATHFPQRCTPIAHIAKPKCHRHGIEGLVGERQLQSVRNNAISQALPACERQHFKGKINACNSGMRQSRLQGNRQIATASGNIEQAGWIPTGDNPASLTTPEEIAAKAEKMVRQIIPRSDAIEHLPHESGIARTCCFFRRTQPSPFAQNRGERNCEPEGAVWVMIALATK